MTITIQHPTDAYYKATLSTREERNGPLLRQVAAEVRDPKSGEYVSTSAKGRQLLGLTQYEADCLFSADWIPASEEADGVALALEGLASGESIFEVTDVIAWTHAMSKMPDSALTEAGVL